MKPQWLKLDWIWIEFVEKPFLTKTVEDGYSKTGIEGSSLDELEEREQEFVNDLRKEDEFFHTENNEVEIQLLG